MDEKGIIKFNCHWKESAAKEFSGFEEINHFRNLLYDLKYIGVYRNGTGYGNVSIKNSEGIYITGSATGNISRPDTRHYSQILRYNLSANSLDCTGPVKASSESLTHAVLYDLDNSIGAVIHIHNNLLWHKLIDRLPTTKKEVEYGTPEMATEIVRLYKETKLSEIKILIMGGHEEGIVSFGTTLEEAMKILVSCIQTETI